MADESQTTQTAQSGSGNLVDDIIQQTKMAREEYQVQFAKNLLKVVGQEAEAGALTEISKTDDLISVLQARVAQIDHTITAQVNEILHHQEFQKLESSWTGLHNFVLNTRTGDQIKIRVLNANKADLLNDVKRAVDFDQMALFKKVYEEEYGTFGGNPISFLVSDLAFGRGLQDFTLMRGIAQVAAAAHAPFIASASPSMFDIDSFFDLEKPRDLRKTFESVEMGQWTSFRQTDDAKYITLTLPRIIQRLPYGPDHTPIEEFNFIEDVNGIDNTKYLWGTPAFALAERITEAHYRFGWSAAIRGVETGGLVDNLPIHRFESPEGEKTYKCPLECIITDRREKELNDIGFMSLCARKNSSQAVFFGGHSFGMAQKYKDAESNANAQLTLQLPHVLVVSRFAHYIKVMVRDKIGGFDTAEQLQLYLHNWLMSYVLGNSVSTYEMKAAVPLKAGKVEVTEIPGMPGSYNAVVYLSPHFQLEELTVSMRLVASLPGAAAA